MSMQENKLNWPLMKDCITQEDKNEMLQFISTSGRFTNGPHVKEFEQQKFITKIINNTKEILNG